mgnify:FL=1
MVTRPHMPAGGDCETDAAAMIARQLPHQHHPLTLAHIAGARATTHSAMADAVKLIRALEKEATEQTIAACRVAAEILIERKQA